MARQLVFTSAPQGLTPGRTGFCTVARHGDLRERLVPMIEGLSVYPHGWQPAPVICSFRLLELAGQRFPLLSRLVDAGHDYTRRTNFLAHHLLLEPAEIAGLPTPADIFLRWPGWLNRWDAEPRWLDDAALVDLQQLPPAPQPALPARTWQNLTGDAGHAALLLEGVRPARRLVRCTSAQENLLLPLFRESSALMDNSEAWRTEFVTALQSSDSATDFCWAAQRKDLPAEGATTRPIEMLDLTQLSLLPAPPANAVSRRARQGDAAGAAPPRPRTPVAATTSTPSLPLAKTPPAAPPAAALPAPPVTNTTASKTTVDKKVNGLVIGLGVLLAGGVGVLLWMWLVPAAPTPAPPPPETVTVTAPTKPSASVPNQQPPSPATTLSSATTAIANQQQFIDLQNLARDGQFYKALGLWKTLVVSSPELAQVHEDYFRSTLLPGAQKDWQNQLQEITARLEAGPLDAAARQALAAQMADLRDFPTTWPLPDAAALTQAWSRIDSELAVIARLPNAPVWLVDHLTSAGAGPDYQEFSGTLKIPEVTALLQSPTLAIHAAAVTAANFSLPPDDQWFHFDLRGEDFSPGDFIVLPDASRGASGGRFLQLLAEGPGAVRLTWRVFTAESDFFKQNPGNAALRAGTDHFWVRLSRDSGPAVYLLLRLPPGGAPTWKPLRLPVAWLAAQNEPTRLALPAWLARGLTIHAPAPFWLLPPNRSTIVAAGFAALAGKPATELASVGYTPAWFADQRRQAALSEKTDLAQLQETLASLEKQLRDNPVGERPDPVDVDQTRLAVEKLKNTITQDEAQALAATQPNWARTTAPWALLYGPDAAHLSPLIEFSADATGSTP